MTSHITQKSEVWYCVVGGVAVGAIAGLAGGLLYANNSRRRPGKYTLSYYKGRGLAEIPRLLFTLAGVDFEDNRVAEAPSKTSNLGRMPQLKVDFKNGKSVVVGQSHPICLYVANKTNLLGDDEESAARIDEICACVKDLKEAFRKLYPYGGTPTRKDWESVWFDTLAKDADEGDRSKRQLQWYLRGIEDLVGADGFAFGKKVSLADVYLYNCLFEHYEGEFLASEFFSKEKQAKLRFPFYSASKARCRDVVKKAAPKIFEICTRFENSPAVAKYLENRTPGMF